MDSAASYGGAGYEMLGYGLIRYDSDSLTSEADAWTPLLLSAREKRLLNRPEKKRHRALRTNRKPSRPTGYIGQRTNNRLLRICSRKRLPESEQAEPLE